MNEDKHHITCNDIIALASDYFEGELSEIKKQKFDDHFETCPECKNFFQEFLYTIDMICGPCQDDYQEIKMPEEVETRILTYLLENKD